MEPWLPSWQQQEILTPIYASNIQNAANVPSPSLPTDLNHVYLAKHRQYALVQYNYLLHPIRASGMHYLHKETNGLS
jgi:hypothetical protein